MKMEKFKDFIKGFTSYTFVEIKFEKDNFIFIKNYAAYFKIKDRRFDDCDFITYTGDDYGICVTLKHM